MYKITVEKITITEYPEKKEIFYDNVTKKSYNSQYDFQGDDYKRSYTETGKKLIRKDEETVFEQTLEDLNIGQLAVFINSEAKG